MEKIKLIAFDLDGTLLTRDKRLTPENEDALYRAAGLGIELVPATGRFWSAMPEELLRLPFLRYAITINGAQVRDLRNDRALTRAELPWETAVEILSYLDTVDAVYDCYQENWGWMTQSHRERAGDYTASIHSLAMVQKYRKPVPELKAYLREQGKGIQKLQCFFRDDALRRRVWAELERRFPQTAVTSSLGNNLEINAREATKGRALEQLAAHLGLALSQTAAFGDDSNDVSMLRAAGVGIAMANAAPEAKAAADRLTLSCDESGFAAALDSLL